jgi:hypothetical protein
MLGSMNNAEAELAGQPEPRDRPGHTLFSSLNVSVATFLGSVLAGSVLLAINYRRLGRGRHALLSVVIGFAATSLLCVLAFFVIPDSVPRPLYTAINIAIAFGMRLVADALQGEALSAHEAAGGRVGAGWATAGISLAILALLAGAVLAGWLADSSRLGDSVELGKLTVYYKDGATETEARRTGEYLREQGMTDHEIDVQLLRRDGTLHVLFVVDQGAGSADEFRLVGRDLSAHCFGGAPLVIDLADPDLEVHTSIPVDSR